MYNNESQAKSYSKRATRTQSNSGGNDGNIISGIGENENYLLTSLSFRFAFHTTRALTMNDVTHRPVDFVSALRRQVRCASDLSA